MKTQPDSSNTLVLKTGLFNDADLVMQALQQTGNTDITFIDIDQETASSFTDQSWDDVIDAILACNKIITV